MSLRFIFTKIGKSQQSIDNRQQIFFESENLRSQLEASITNCLRKLGIEIPLTAKTIRRDVAKIQEIVKSNHYSEAGKNALHTLLAR